jgi:peptidoglycan-associated lipoprotein
MRRISTAAQPRGAERPQLRANPNARSSSKGTDDRGTIEYNPALAARQGGQGSLDHNGSRARISTISYGKELPLCHEQTETCFARNRRVHFVVLGQ